MQQNIKQSLFLYNLAITPIFNIDSDTMYTEMYQEHSNFDQSRVSNQSFSKTQKESVINDDKKKS